MGEGEAVPTAEAASESSFDRARRELEQEPRTWLITGAAGFIGSHLTELLLGLGQRVIGLDNFATGFRHNLDAVHRAVGDARWADFRFIEGDIRDVDECRRAFALPADGAGERWSVDVVLHQAALGSVPRSIADPLSTHATNLDGFLNMLVASHEAGVRRFVFAASSSTYGDSQRLPKVEDEIGRPLNPYAVTKVANELYAEVFGRTFGMETIGLRYFNVFGPRQDPDGPYAAVIPKWIAGLIGDTEVYLNGDGETSRDFCYVGNVVQANILAAVSKEPAALNQVFNVAIGGRTTLNELFQLLRDGLQAPFPHCLTSEPVMRDFREGDVRHSLADIGKARRLLGYEPTHTVGDGLTITINWHSSRWLAANGSELAVAQRDTVASE